MFYAPRQVHTPHSNRDTIAATFRDIAAEVLRSSNCALPLSFTAKVNCNGTVTLLGVDPTNPAKDYSPFFSALAAQLNKSFPVGTSPWLPFRPAPNENQFAIHGSHSGTYPVTLKGYSSTSNRPSSTPKA